MTLWRSAMEASWVVAVRMRGLASEKRRASAGLSRGKPLASRTRTLTRTGSACSLTELCAEMEVGLAVCDEEAMATRKDATTAHERRDGSDRRSPEANIRNSFRGRYRQTTQEGGGGQDSRATNNRKVRSLLEEGEKVALNGDAASK